VGSSDALRDEGGFEFKKAIVDAIIKIIDTIPQAKEEGVQPRGWARAEHKVTELHFPNKEGKCIFCHF